MDLKKLFEKRRADPKTRREFYTLSLILIPTALMGIVSMSIEGFLERSVAQMIILFLQGVTIKGIIENK